MWREDRVALMWRHGVHEGAIRHALDYAIRVMETDDGLFVIGPSEAGRMLELNARPISADELLVFDAMPLRPANARRYLP